jgi:hypothetical protein
MDFYKEIKEKEILIIVDGYDLEYDYRGAWDEEGNEVDYEDIPADIIAEIEEELDEAYFEKYGEARREETADQYKREEYTPWNWGW